jgi:2-keto-4-pentenoate hydratase/2-oxohepta-3-ene-1,7-dioic acid hydratase in catechol pathway
MKLASFKVEGKASYGVVVDETKVIDVGAVASDRWADLKAVLAAEALDEVKEISSGDAPERDLDKIEFQLPITAPDKILCIGRNYKNYIATLEVKKPLNHPSMFVRVASSFAAHGQAIEKPDASDELDFETELAVVIGPRGRNISEANALSHVAGYTILNEGSIRDWQKRGAQNAPGKNFYHSGSMGPWMVTADEIPDPSTLTITTRLNDADMQEGGTDMMIYNIPFLISYFSQMTWLEPGDIIATGSPSGSGGSRDPQVWMKSGDRLEAEISQIGILRNSVENQAS